MSDELGDRMKMYESLREPKLMPGLPTLARVDGRAFHSFARGMSRPYDLKMMLAMITTATEIAEETNSLMAYAQSDEITFLWYSDNPKSQIWFDGRFSKMVSQIAALATIHFYRACAKLMPERLDKMPTFDGRVWQVPSKAEAANAFLWREWDATKNSITMAASSVYSHREIHGKNGNEKQEMLFRKGINWNDYPPSFKRGSFIQRRIIEKPFSAEEIERLPEKHEARRNPSLKVLRSDWRVIEMPPFSTVKNREDVIFCWAEPKTETEAKGKQ